MTVLLTGGTGFLGRHVLTALAGAGHDVVATCRGEPPVTIRGVRWLRVDLHDRAAVGALMRDERPTHLLHMGWRAVYSDVAGARDNTEWLKTSLDLATAFIDAGGMRIVGSGSCFEYDWADGICIEDVTPLNPSTYYGACKDALRAALTGLTREAGVSFCWPRMFFAYGPGENEARFVAHMARALLRGEPAEMTEGLQVRDFLYAGDIADALAEIVASDVTGVLNIGSGDPVQLRDIAFTLADQLGRRDLLRLGARAQKPHEPPRIIADMTRTHQALSWRARTSLNDGLARTIEALRAPQQDTSP
ncbi:MAG: NAD(P)-dependent oxidoreductase [Hyphomonadaceae bacterium]|nr:NAD(P)-dependent oxidoreductase [Hyphomonadaceae bacterium]